MDTVCGIFPDSAAAPVRHSAESWLERGASMARKRIDRRVTRSRARLHDALVSLVAQRG
jgi:hypothetical protein